MDDYYSDSQPDLIHCEYCGRDYAPDAADRGACPFCHTTPAGKKVRSTVQKQSSRGRSNSRGGGYGGARSPLSVIGIVLSVILIVAALVIVIVLAKTAISNRLVKTPSDADPSGVISSQEDEGSALQGGDAQSSGETGQPEEQTPAQVISAESITLSETALSMSEGDTATLTATVTPEDYSGSLMWSSSDGAVAIVDQTGKVTYVGGGTCTITVSAGEIKAECTVTCEAPDGSGDLAVLAYNTEKDDVTLSVGEVVPFEAQGGDGSYTWSVENTGIATVTDEGKLTAIAAGTTTMTVKSGAYSIDVIIRVK